MSEATSSNEYREQRLANLAALQELGYPPYGGAFKRSGSLAELREDFAEERPVTAAGRLTTVRDMGKSIFADLRDGSDRFQIYVQKKAVGDEAFQAFKLLDLGDQIGVEGAQFTTRTGEATIKVATWTLLSKALLPPPEKWHGLKDVELRYRQRYLDLVGNPEVRELFNKRSAMILEIRSYLAARDFIEVETPMLQSQAGGAAAKPFVTHYGALGSDVYLRIAPELYLKRLLVGGFDKVFELNRNFRNEGLDRTHNPEFTMLEIYEAFSDVNGMRELIQGMITHVAESVFGGLKVGEGDTALDLTPPWREATYHELVREKMGDDWFDLSLADACAKAEGIGLDLDPAWDKLMVTHEVYEKTIEPALMQPTFVTRLPASLVPLARACPDDPSLVDVFELVIRGQEVAPAYTEMNDPIEQRRRFMEQAGDDAAKIDQDFVTALEHGMPPAGGMGVGIDRLMMILSGAEAIRDVILFPQLKRIAD
ncbi:MAG: lysine--tRNA ligase [Verrucomicrobia bacterium]|jgi:lysyl-tRNA synthetase, class II|nr:lysine--tRNA ligase [Verrucomicrobiota bacterium]MBT7067549.1 lysine--tRNA ligase [Verrucomicrobiota bacterium]MBT7698706.1 lysine--tRNA ligase [Verrucomicrobiota bacterium]